MVRPVGLLFQIHSNGHQFITLKHRLQEGHGPLIKPVHLIIYVIPIGHPYETDLLL